MDRAKAIGQLQAYAGEAIPYRFKRDILKYRYPHAGNGQIAGIGREKSNH